MKKLNSMKKILIVCVALTLAFSLVGCGKKASTDNNTATTPTAVATAAPTVAPTEVPFVTGTHEAAVPEKDKIPEPPIVIKDTSDQNKKLTADEKAKMKRVVAFTQNLANDRLIVISTVSADGKVMVGTFEVKPEVKAADAKTMAGKYAAEMKTAYGQSVKVIITQNGKIVAEATL